MKHQNFNIDQSEGQVILDKSPIFSVMNARRLAYTFPFRVGLTVLLVCGGATVLLSRANAITPDLTAQISASATVIYVNPETGADSSGAGNTEGAPYKTINYALSQAQSNTVIQLAHGSYTKDTGEVFPLVIKPGVTLRGDEATKGQTTAIIGGDRYISPTFASQNITVRAEKDSRVTGVTMTNPNTRGTALWIESTNPTVENSTFSNSKREGIFVTGTGTPTIKNNVFTNNAGNGISVAKSARGEIRNNLFQGTGFGLAISQQSSPLIADNSIIQNYQGIVINGTARPVLRNNVIQNNRDGGIVITQNGQPDLGTAESPGKNLIRNNGSNKPKSFDLANATSNTIVAVGNDIDPSRISGSVDFVAASVTPPDGQVGFTDVQGWAKPYIEALAAKDIIAGFPDGTFKPNQPVTRAQFATIINKAFSPPTTRAGVEFTDVRQNFWAYKAIQSAYRGAFLTGYPDSTFRPNQNIPRVQVLVSLANGLELSSDNPSVLSVYTDASQIPNYATSYVAAATQKQLVVNYPTPSQLNPQREATRAEVAAFVYQALVNAGRAEAISSPYLVSIP